MNILLSEHAGFCFGVRRAVELLESRLSEGKKIYTLGHIIHNEDFNADLERRGVVCVSPEDGSVQSGTNNCMMCKRVILNAGIETVVIRDDKENFRVIKVSDWIEDDDSLSGRFGYSRFASSLIL